jgi:hypothetical protein
LIGPKGRKGKRKAGDAYSPDLPFFLSSILSTTRAGALPRFVPDPPVSLPSVCGLLYVLIYFL